MGTGREPSSNSPWGLIPSAAWIVAWKSAMLTGFLTGDLQASSPVRLCGTRKYRSVLGNPLCLIRTGVLVLQQTSPNPNRVNEHIFAESGDTPLVALQLGDHQIHAGRTDQRSVGIHPGNSRMT